MEPSHKVSWSDLLSRTLIDPGQILDAYTAFHCRGYIQHWAAGAPIPETAAARIFRVADQILRAGQPEAV